MAQDEYFLTHLPDNGLLLYFYVNENAVIMGRNQNAYRECDLAAMAAENVSLVRRITGGGAVYHDGGNLNFSFIAPEEFYNTEEQDEILLAALHALGIEAEKDGRNDFSAGGRKFSGNAFGGKGGNRVRHGTLLISSDLGRLERYLTVSAKKLRAKGIASVRRRVCNLSELCPGLTVEAAANAIRRAFEARYGMAAAGLTLSPEAEGEITALREARASFDWLMGEAPAFDYAFEERFSFGMAELCLSVTDGRIARVELYTDALDTALSDTVKAALTGEPFSPEGIRRALESTASPAATELGAYIAVNL